MSCTQNAIIAALTARTGELATVVTVNDLQGVDLFGDAKFRTALGGVQETPSISLQHDFVRVDASNVCVQISRTRAETVSYTHLTLPTKRIV